MAIKAGENVSEKFGGGYGKSNPNERDGGESFAGALPLVLLPFQTTPLAENLSQDRI